MLELNITKPFYKRLDFILLVFFTSLLTIFLIFRNIIQTNKKVDSLERKALVAEYKSLTSILNPHFIFNTLSSLQTLVRENKNVIAEKYLLLFSSLIRLNMKNVIKEKVLLEHELDIVEKYLQIEKLRFKELFDFSIQVPEELFDEEIYLPPLTIQPIVENSIKHAFFRVFGKKGLISITVNKMNDDIIISVEDNGQGLDESAVSSIHNQRIHSLDVIQKRFLYFKKIYDIDISIDIKNVMNESTISGTKVTLVIGII